MRDTQLNVDESTVTNVNRSNFKLKAIYDVKLDSVNSLKITANSNFYDTESDEFTNGTTTGSDGILKNKQQRAFTTNSDKAVLFTSVLFKHKFAKPRRTFTVNSSWNMMNTNSNNFLKSSNESYVNGVFDTKNEKDQNFEDTATYRTVTKLYKEKTGKEPFYAMMPEVVISGPKLSRDYNTNWFASRVNGRYQTCMNKIKHLKI